MVTHPHCQVFWVSPIRPISGMGSYGFHISKYIHRVHPNKSPLKIFEKRECGHTQELSNFWGVSPIISETGKAADFEFGRYIQKVHPNKYPLNIYYSRKGSAGVSKNSQSFLGVGSPPIISGTGKATSFNFSK